MPETPQTVGLLLIPGFALMSYASVVEPLRAANLLAGKELYRWIHISPGPATVTASCGATVPCPVEAGDAVKLDLLLVCAGGNPTAFKDRVTLQWLKTLAARGLRIGGVSGGPVILARAGIMDGYHMTVHWEHAPAVAEGFPNIMLTRSIYIVDRNRLTCAGGTAPLDMMHALIAERHGPELARRVSDWFMHTDIRPAQSAQRASLTERYGVHDDRLTAALELMESHPGEPLKGARRRGASGCPRARSTGCFPGSWAPAMPRTTAGSGSSGHATCCASLPCRSPKSRWAAAFRAPVISAGRIARRSA